MQLSQPSRIKKHEKDDSDTQTVIRLYCWKKKSIIHKENCTFHGKWSEEPNHGTDYATELAKPFKKSRNRKCVTALNVRKAAILNRLRCESGVRVQVAIGNVFANYHGLQIACHPR